MIMISSSPYIFLRPTTSARYPKPSCPITVPPDVETLIAVSEWGGRVPCDFESWKKDIPSIAVTKLIAKIWICLISTYLDDLDFAQYSHHRNL